VRHPARCASLRSAPGCTVYQPAPDCKARLPACLRGASACNFTRGAPAWLGCAPAFAVRLPWRVTCLRGVPGYGEPGDAVSQPACAARQLACARLRGAPGYAARLHVRCACLCGAHTLVGHLSARCACNFKRGAHACVVCLSWWVTCLRGAPAWLRGEPGDAVSQPACAARQLACA